MQWSDLLSWYNFNLCYHSEKLMLISNILSCCTQNMLINTDDERLKKHKKCLFSSEMFKIEKSQNAIHVFIMQHISYLKASSTITESTLINPNHDQEIWQIINLENQWYKVEQQDKKISILKHVIHEDFLYFLKELCLHISISECELDDENRLHFWKHHWILNNEVL